MTFCRGNHSESKRNLNGTETVGNLLASKAVFGDQKLFLAPGLQKNRSPKPLGSRRVTLKAFSPFLAQISIFNFNFKNPVKTPQKPSRALISP